MSCGVFFKRLPLISLAVAKPQYRALALAAPTQPRKKTQYEILGTWDYKWPTHSKIRVAFQELPLDTKVFGSDDPRVIQDGDVMREFKAAREHVIEVANLWRKEVERKRPELLPLLPELEFTSEVESLAPPLGTQHSLTDQHRSPFLDTHIQYDVLVSLQDLPIYRLDPFRDPGSELETLSFPIADLGCYARRTDYGAPTMYIGRFGHSLRLPLVKYLKSVLGKHVILHEFGHVYGLPHMFQSPHLIKVGDRKQVPPQERKDFFRTSEEIIAITEQLLGIKLTEQQVVGHVLALWPGSDAFSDWVEFSRPQRTEHTKTGKLPSVMTMPHYSYLLAKDRPLLQPDAEERKLKLIEDGTVVAVTAKDIVVDIGRLDLDMLSLMYDPNSEVGSAQA